MQGCLPQIKVGCLLLSCLATCFSVVAAEIPPTWIDDAQLHDVKTVGSKLAFAVGEHGAIWKSVDGGRSWTASHCEIDASLQSICLLDDRTGWIAGRNTTAYSGLDNGILLATQDGGKTWQQIARDVLPALSYVKFFGLEEGLVVGQPTSVSPTGIFRTNDGGKTWRGVQGEAAHSWKAMCFLEPEMGVVAGVQGRVSVMGGEQLYPSKLQPQGFRSIRSIGLLSNDKGWLVGEAQILAEPDHNRGRVYGLFRHASVSCNKADFACYTIAGAQRIVRVALELYRGHLLRRCWLTGRNARLASAQSNWQFPGGRLGRIFRRQPFQIRRVRIELRRRYDAEHRAGTLACRLGRNRRHRENG